MGFRDTRTSERGRGHSVSSGKTGEVTIGGSVNAETCPGFGAPGQASSARRMDLVCEDSIWESVTEWGMWIESSLEGAVVAVVRDASLWLVSVGYDGESTKPCSSIPKESVVGRWSESRVSDVAGSDTLEGNPYMRVVGA